MSDEQGNGDAGNRATVAMVLRTVEGLSRLTDAHFETMAVEIRSLREDVGGIVPRMERIEAEQRAASMQVLALHTDLNQHKKDSAVRISKAEDAERFRRIHWPTFLVSLAALGAAVASIFT